MIVCCVLTHIPHIESGFTGLWDEQDDFTIMFCKGCTFTSDGKKPFVVCDAAIRIMDVDNGIAGIVYTENVECFQNG